MLSNPKWPTLDRSAACYVFNDYSWNSSVTNMLSNPKWPTLDQCRTYNKLVIFFKLVEGIIEIPTLQLTPLTSITRGHHKRYRIPQARTNLFLLSFLPSTIKLWNNLYTQSFSNYIILKEQLTDYLMM